MKRSKSVITAIIATMLLVSLFGCVSGTSSQSGSSYNPSTNTNNESLKPSLRDPGKMLDDDGVREERALDDYEMHLDYWKTDYDNFLHLLDRGQPEIDFPGYRESIIDWANEIIYYDPSKVPDSYRAVHDQWVGRAIDLKARVY